MNFSAYYKALAFAHELCTNQSISSVHLDLTGFPSLFLAQGAQNMY